MKDIQAITEKLGFKLNEMQHAAVKAILHGDKDVVILSPTGSGKTLAYLLPSSQLLDENLDALQMMVITPGRELASQSASVLKEMGTGLRSMACYGGRPAMEEHKLIKQVKPQVVFGTPGRLNDHLDKGNLSPYNVRLLIIDEFDKCLAMGFHDEMQRLIDKLKGVKRRFLLSATDAEEIPRFVNMHSVVAVDYQNKEEQVSSRVHIYKVYSTEKDKLGALRHLLCHLGEGSSVVFLNYRDAVERVANYLREQGFVVSSFHGGMEQKEREDALYRFSNGSANVLVSTDLTSRGLDIPNIDSIIHYHLPESEEGYIHRVGRTARWDAKGNAFFLLAPSEDVPEYVNGKVEEYAMPDDVPAPAQPRMATLYIGKGKKDKLSKGDIVGFLCKKGGLQASDIGHIDVKERYTYVAVVKQKVAHVLRQTAGEKIKGIKTILEEVR